MVSTCGRYDIFCLMTEAESIDNWCSDDRHTGILSQYEKHGSVCDFAEPKSEILLQLFEVLFS